MSEQANMAAHYEHEIPEGYEARIEGNKVIFEQKESEDEKIKRTLVEHFKGYYDRYASQNNANVHWKGLEVKKVINYLEKQKIFSEKGEGVYGYKDGKICFLGQWLNNSMYPCDAPIGRDADGNLIYMEDLEDEKQKEPHYNKRNALFDKCVENCDPAIMKEVSDNVDKMLEKEQKPAERNEEDERMYKAVSIALTLNEAKGYLRSWHITPEEADTWLKSLLPQPEVEWSEEDEAHLKWLCRIVHSKRVDKVITLKEESELGEWMDKWLNHNPLPRWKPNKEQIEALKDTIFFDDFFDKTVFRKKKLVSLLEALEKLM